MSISVVELRNVLSRNDEKYQLIDVREPREFARDGRIAQARNIPLSTFKNNFTSLEINQTIYVICRSGVRSAQGVAILKKSGYSKVLNVNGGMLDWVKKGYAVI